MQVIPRDPNEIKVHERMRKDYGDLTEFAANLKRDGQIHPIRITTDDYLIVGGRRLEACKLAGIMVDTVVKEDCSPVELKRLELYENLDRKEMTWQEKVRGIAEIDALERSIHGDAKPGRGKGGWSLADTAKVVNSDPGNVYNDIKIANAMEAIPALAQCKTQKDAKKMLSKITEKMAIAALIDKKKEEGGGLTGFVDKADKAFIVRDAFEGMLTMADVSVDFINADTPYGIDLTSQKKIQSDVRTDDDYKEWSKADFSKNIAVVAGHCFRVLKNDRWMLFWFGQEWYKEVLNTLEAAGFKVDKIPAAWFGGAGGAQTMAPDVNLARCYEQFFVCRKGEPVLLKRGRLNVFEFDKVAPQKKIHPTEKPLELMIELIDTFVMPGSLGFSPFIGSGNDIRAGFIRHCDWTGFDLNGDVKNKYLLRVEEDIEQGLYGK